MDEPLAVPASLMSEAAPPEVRQVYAARVARIVGSGVLLLFVGLALLISALLFTDDGHPRQILPAWGVLALIVSACVWLGALAMASLRFDRLAPAGREAGIFLARRLETRSVLLPLAAGIFVLPSLACAASATLLTTDSAMGAPHVGDFLHLSLLAFFPVHLLAAVLALQFGWELLSRSSQASARFPWWRSMVTLASGVAASALWGTMFFPNDLGGVASVVFVSGLVAVPALFGLVKGVLLRERWILDEAARGRRAEPSIR